MRPVNAIVSNVKGPRPLQFQVAPVVGVRSMGPLVGREAINFTGAASAGGPRGGRAGSHARRGYEHKEGRIMKRLSGTDAFFLFTEQPTWPMHVGALVIIDASDAPGWGFESFRNLLAERVPLVPEFAMKVKEVPFGLDRPLLVRDPDFTLDYHLHRIAVSSPGGPRELGELVAGLTEIHLDRRRPLWDAWFIEGVEHGRFAMFVKTHHALVDGVSGAGLLELLCDFEPNPAPRPLARLPEPERVPSDIELVARGAVSALMSPGRTVRWALDFVPRTLRSVRRTRQLGGRTALDRAPDHVPFVGTLGPLRRFAFTTLPLEDVRRIKNAHGVKVNDVILAVASGAVRQWLLARDALPEQSLVTAVPMSLHAEGDTERGTKVTTLFCDLETQIDDPVERLRAIAASMQSVKEIANAIKATEIRRLSETVVPGLANLAWRVYQAAHMEAMPFVPSNLVVSNIPGPRMPLYMAGGRILAMHPVPPNILGGGLNITVMSYMDSVDFGFVTDREMIEDPWELVDGLHASFDALMATSSEHGELGDAIRRGRG
jgi:diacylglycerol O-acyltransferase